MSTHSTSQPPSRNIHFTIPSDGTHDTSFTFTAQPRPAMTLHFPPRPSPPRVRKRGRAVTDVDGELSCLHKKKRRLRLFLITSRLSPQFSYPATNIVDRGSSKIAVWAKQKALGRNLLRKAAILNRIRWRAWSAREMDDGQGRVLVEQEKEQKQLELAKLALLYGSHDTHTRPVVQRGPSVLPMTAVRVGDHYDLSSDLGGPSARTPSPQPQPSTGDQEAQAPTFRSPNDAYSTYSPPRAQIPRRSYLPLPPSPLGLSNYDAFDMEDDIPDPYSHLDDDDPYDQSGADDEGLRDVDPRSPSAHTSASFSTTLSTVATGTSEAPRTPANPFYSDFNILDPGEPVVRDYDQVDEGADHIWPTTALVDTATDEHVTASSSHSSACSQQVLPASSSPNFTAHLAPSDVVVVAAVSRAEAAAQEYPFRPATCEIAEEKERQKSFMFASLGS